MGLKLNKKEYKLTKEEFINAVRELALDFWGMCLTNGTYESNFRELLDKYESEKEFTETHIVDSSKFNKIQFDVDCNKGERLLKTDEINKYKEL